ncbi:condensation domain-containing protein [Nocardiopsis terrae]
MTDTPADQDAGRPAPLSHAQERMWFADAAAPGNATYNEPLLFVWNEPVDPVALTGALNHLVRRHAILRTSYRPVGGLPVQEVADPDTVTPEIQVDDLTGVANADARVREEAGDRARDPFDLEAPVVPRCHVWRGAPGGDAVLMVFHHIAVDGGSYPLLFRELSDVYDALVSGARPSHTDPEHQYADLAARERERTSRPDHAARVKLRAEQLSGVPRGLVLAGHLGASAAPEGSRPGSQQRVDLGSGVREHLHQAARKLRVTPYVIVLAAFQALLGRWSGRDRLLIGTVLEDRSARTRNVPGLFVNTVPLRTEVFEDDTFAGLCARSRVEAYGSLTHRTLPFDQLSSAATALGDRGRAPLVDVGLVFQDSLHASGDSRGRWDPPVLLGTGTAKFDLLLHVDDCPEGLTAVLEYDTELYGQDTARALGAAFADLLTAAVTDPERRIVDLPGAPPAHLAVPGAPEGAFAGGTPPTSAAARAAPVDPETPATPDELRAAELFAAALDDVPGARRTTAAQLAPSSDFFALGGHSLAAVAMIAEARRRYGAALAPRDFLGAPTVATLAGLLRTASRSNGDEPEPGTSPDQGGDHPATSVQQRFWFLDRVPEQRVAYLVPTVVEYPAALDHRALLRATAAVLERHPSLRSRFRLDRVSRTLVYRTDGPPPEAVLTDATGWTPEQVRERVADLSQSGFDLAGDAPARAEVIFTGSRVLLVLVLHHIVADGASRDLVLDQITRLYRALTLGGTADLPAPVHPARMARPRPGTASTTAMIRRLEGAPTDVALPHDRPRREGQSTLALRRGITLDAEHAGGLSSAAVTGAGYTPFMVSAALVGAALARVTGQRDLLVAFPWNERDTAEGDDAVAMLVNTLVLRLDFTGNPTWWELLARIKESCALCYRNADASFDELVAALHPERDLSRPPLTPVYLAHTYARPEGVAPGPGIRASLLPIEPPHTKYELEFDIVEHAGGIEITALAMQDLFDPATVEGLLDTVAEAARDLAADPASHTIQGDLS